MEIAVLLYDKCAAMDVAGPYEVFRLLPDATVRFAAAEPGPVRDEGGFLSLTADHSLSDVRPDVIMIPGGTGTTAMMEDPAILSWLRTAHQTSTWTTSVCSGSLILAAAGLLEDRRATCHWLAAEFLRAFGAQPTPERVVVDGKVVTAAGVSAGIDMALTVAARIAGDEVAKAIQLLIEYDPQPPFDAGSPAKAPDSVVEFLRTHRDELFRKGTVDLGPYRAAGSSHAAV